jgi:ATP-binding cassette, subfamily C (CFTR/MRP), member 1
MKRFSSVNRSPLYSHFSETLNGLTTIRSYQCSERFKEESFDKLNLMQRTFYSEKGLDMWLQFRLSLLGSLLVSSVSLVLMIIYHYSRGKQFDLPSAGLALTYSIQVTQLLTFLVQQLVKLESEFNSVERIVHYGKNLPQEQIDFQIQPEKTWPKKGEIVFKDFSMKYREELPYVLKNLNITIKSNEKIGIAGRTGSGKSSLMLVLFRLIEHTKGKIFIDEMDISRIPLSSLRRSLAIIPQDPVLFSGTVRSNIDPFTKYQDSQIWRALEKSQLKDFIKKQKNELLSEVHEGGHNFSVGQRQLICLTRCILEKKKILIMDEATSSMVILKQLNVRTLKRTHLFKNLLEKILEIAPFWSLLID